MKSLLAIFFLTFFVECFIIFVSLCRSRLCKGQLSAVLPAGKKSSVQSESTTEKIQRTDEKLRQQFKVLGKMQWVLLRGHIYEQRNVMVTARAGAAVSEQFSSFDAVLQSLPVNMSFTIQFTGQEEGRLASVGERE